MTTSVYTLTLTDTYGGSVIVATDCGFEELHRRLNDFFESETASVFVITKREG